jgi:hypothetical protein
MEAGNMEPIFFAVEVFQGCSHTLLQLFNHFYSDLCTQSPENQLFLLPEKEDSEQHPEGNELLSLV